MPGSRSLRLRLTLWYVLLLAIILAAFSAGVYFTLRYNLNVGLDDSVDNRANVLLDVVRYQDGRPTLDDVVPSSDPSEDNFVRVFDASGQVTFENSTAEDAAVDREAVESALSGRPRNRDDSTSGDSFRVRAVPIERDGEVSGVLEVGQSDDVSETLRILLIIIGVAYPVTLATASFGGAFLAGRALAPIDRMTRLARRITAEDLSQRLDLRLPDDELGRLARTFDEMIARLDEAFRRQKQFTADASHELRTPLTAIKGQTEVALSRPRDAESYREVLQAVNEEADRMIRLVGSLLTLARADAGQIPIATDDVDLPALVAAAAEQVRPLMESRNVELRVEDGPPVSLRADEDLLLQLLLNLLDNAGKYTPAGGRATVGWSVDGGHAALTVTDSGAGIAPEKLPHIFERFYRVDPARSREQGGSGLGLSICRWIAEAHGGAITAQSAQGQGSTFTVRLPLL